jgi:hypothetical protein
LCVGLVGLAIPYFSKSFLDNVYPARDDQHFATHSITRSHRLRL